MKRRTSLLYDISFIRVSRYMFMRACLSVEDRNNLRLMLITSVNLVVLTICLNLYRR